MITLVELINATAWLKPQEHIKISLWDKSKLYEDGEYTDIELTVCNLAKYANYSVGDLIVEYDNKDNAYLSCTIWKD
jgi:hypothetical protein